MKQRIWELDAFRGICVLGMIAVHFVYDLTSLYRLVDWTLPETFLFVQKWGGVLFLLLSGICVTLGKRSVRRGLIVLGSGLLVSAVTFGMWKFFSYQKGIIIYFGVLHCLGVCMMLYPLFKKSHWGVLLGIGAALVAAGFALMRVTFSFPWLIPLGLRPERFQSSDYFPLLPYFGFFLLGAALGKTLYRNQTSLLPKGNPNNLIVRFLTGCGRHSLWIYLLHQPVLSGLLYLLSAF